MARDTATGGMDARTWMTECTATFLRTVDGLTGEQLAGPSLLPGWSRAHVVAHVHHNAQALGRLVSWAATGVEERMYPSVEHRNAEIEASAALPGEELKRLVRESAEALAADLAKLPDEAWSRRVTTFRGGSIPASEIPWLRAREVAVHMVDLDAGVGFADLPADLVAALVREVVDKRLGDGEGPQLAAWLTGRTAQPTALAPWL
jgi:uncharacterized protein (TIGR03083 family)